MISARYHFIFLHVPKTAGNAIQTYLLPHSDDAKVRHAHQDGVERFDVRGAITPTKHAPLQAYADRLGDALSDYAVILPIRHPVDRALSLYFSPHRAIGQGPDFVPAFDLVRFAALLQQAPGMVDYLTVDGTVHRPDFLLRFDNLGADLAAAADRLALPAPTLPVLNRSLDQRGERQRLREDRDLVALVRQRFAADFAYFNF